AQLLGIGRPAGAVEVGGAGHQQLLDLAEAAHHQAAVVVEPGAHADGDVEAFVDHVHAAVAHVHLHPDLRVFGEEVGQQSRDLLLRQPHRDAHPHHAARLRAEAVDHFARGLRLGQHRLCVAVHALADVGDGEPARGTLQQAYAQLRFQLADAPAQARLGDPECAFRGGESAVVDDGREVVEVVEVLHGDSSKFRTFRDIRACLFRNSNNLVCTGRGTAACQDPIMKLLHIDSSALGTNSASREISAAIVARWRADVPGLSVQYRDLDADPLPHLDGNGLAKADPARAEESERVLQHFLDADVVVIGAPMYNFSIPSTLKA